MRNVRSALPMVTDPIVEEYVQNLGYRLASHSSNYYRNFHFFVVDSTQINAFAGPGGYIGINSGLILAAQSESEVAAVMAHEIAHVTQRHIARSIEMQKALTIPSMAALLASLVIATQSSEAGTAAIAATLGGTAQKQINFIRQNEKEADRVGIQTLADAGFDPFGMPLFFGRLQKNAKLYGTRPPEFLSTHPVTLNRISEATTRAESYPRVPQYTNLDFLLIQAKLRANDYKNPKQVLADVRRYKGKGGGKAAVDQYEFALLLSLTENHAAARKVMEKLQKGDPDRIAYRLALARIMTATKDYDAALQVYADTLELYPGEMTVALPYANTLLSSGQLSEAYTLLNKVAETNPSSPRLHKLLAQAAGATGHKVRTHTAMAQYYFLNGYTDQAIEQLKLAEKSPLLTSYQIARIQARISDLERLLELEKLE